MLIGQADREEFAQLGRQGRPQGLDASPDGGLACAVSRGPVVWWSPPIAELGPFDACEDDKGRRGLAVGMFDEPAVPTLSEGYVGLVTRLAGVDGQDQHVRPDRRVDGRLDPRPIPAALVSVPARIVRRLDPIRVAQAVD